MRGWRSHARQVSLSARVARPRGDVDNAAGAAAWSARLRSVRQVCRIDSRAEREVYLRRPDGGGGSSQAAALSTLNGKWFGIFGGLCG